MAASRTYDVLIAGAGPAGLATALFLLRERPALAGRIAALEKACHPRPKICAGGLIPKAVATLKELGVGLDAPAVEVFDGEARTPVKTINLGRRAEPLCTIVRRDQFDAGLARAACRHGLTLHEATSILGVRAEADRICVETTQGCFYGKVVVGADGSASRVRRDLFGGLRKDHIGRALMVDLPVDPSATDEFSNQRYRFDFNCLNNGLSGYSWSFPCLIDERPHLNLGIYQYRDRRFAQRCTPGLFEELRKAFPVVADRAPTQLALKAFPIRAFDGNDHFATDRALLVGDAAGVDPLMGEGISYALEHGRLAAEALRRSLDGDPDAFAQYDDAMRRGAVGVKLRRLGFAARRFYGPRHRLYFRLVALSRTAQRLGVDWYNGADGADRMSIAQVVVRWVSGALRPGGAS